LHLSLNPDVALNAASASSFPTEVLIRAQQLLLAPPLELQLFFPGSTAKAPFCFSSTDAGAMVARRANEALQPLKEASLLQALSLLTALVKDEAGAVWPENDPCWRRAWAERVVARVREQGLAVDLRLSLLSMSKAQSATLRPPVPRFFFESEGGYAVDRTVLVSAVNAVPPLHVICGGGGGRGGGRGDGARGEGDRLEGVEAVESLPFPSCLVLQYLLFRERVTLMNSSDAVAPGPRGRRGHEHDQGAAGGVEGGKEDEEWEGEKRQAHALDALAGLPSPGGPTPSQGGRETGLGPSGGPLRRFLASAFFGPRGDRPCFIFPLRHAPNARFDALARQHGTQWGFHGSSPGSFHSIVSWGLRSLSGTRGMRNGAAFGDGVYVASKCEVARNFGSWGVPVWKHSQFGNRATASSAAAASGAPPVFAYQVIALCEIIDMPEYRCGFPGSDGSAVAVTAARQRSEPSTSTPVSSPTREVNRDRSEYWVVANDSHLVVRALLLFKDPAILPNAPTFPLSTRTVRQRRGSPGAAANLPPQPSPPLPRAPVARRQLYLHFVLGVMRVILMGTAFIIFLETVEKLLARREKSLGGGRGKRAA